MKINLKQTLKTLEGEDIQNGEGDVITFGTVISNVLLGARVGDKKLLYKLAKKAFGEDELELSEVEKATLKSLLETDGNYNTLATGQILELFD